MFLTSASHLPSVDKAKRRRFENSMRVSPLCSNSSTTRFRCSGVERCRREEYRFSMLTA